MIFLNTSNHAVASLGEDDEGHGILRIYNNDGSPVVEAFVGSKGNGVIFVRDKEGNITFTTGVTDSP